MNTLAPSSLIQIAAAGGGFRLHVENFSLTDLVGIAAAAKPGARIELEGAETLPPHELVRIAAAGRGAVFFL